MSQNRTPSAVPGAPRSCSTAVPADPTTILHRLLWAPTDSLASWATIAGSAVIDLLPPGIERAGYRHDVSREAARDIVIHELVDLHSRLPVCVVYEQPDGHRILGFCQPWPAELLRFITAILERDLVSPANVEAAPVIKLGSR